MSGTGHSHQKGTGLVTATALLHSSGGMLGLLGAGATSGTAALTGTGSIVSGGNSFFYPGTSGPASGISFSGDFLSGLLFKATATGHFLSAYLIWVQSGTNPNPTGATKFALWGYIASTWTLQATATTTSGSLVNGWNVVSLGTPFPLVSGTEYEIVAGINGNFNFTANQFGSGEPFAAGITSGPAFAYSSVSGSAAAPSGDFQGLFSTADSDPTLHRADTNSSDFNPWIDVIVT